MVFLSEYHQICDCRKHRADEKLSIKAQASGHDHDWRDESHAAYGCKDSFKQMLADSHTSRQRQHIRGQGDRALQGDRFRHADAADSKADKDQIGDRKEQTALREGDQKNMRGDSSVLFNIRGGFPVFIHIGCGLSLHRVPSFARKKR